MSRTSLRTAFLWNVLDRLSVVLVVVMSGLAVWMVLTGRAGSQRPGSAPPDPVVEDIESSRLTVSLDGAASAGQAGAHLVLIEFSDFQCPFCGRHAREVLPRIKSEFVDTGSLRYAFMNSPLSATHPLAVGAATAAECANTQAYSTVVGDSAARLEYRRKFVLVLTDRPGCRYSPY